MTDVCRDGALRDAFFNRRAAVPSIKNPHSALAKRGAGSLGRHALGMPAA